MNKIEIELSKTKLFLGIGGSLVFVVLGLYFITVIADQQTRFSPLVVKGIGIASVMFFGATGIYSIKKTFDNKVGLTIDDDGIFDNTNASSVGLIKWTDITDIRTEQVASTKFLLIYTANPDFYLNKVKGFKRKLMEGNNKMYGTPLSITSNTIKYNFNDLEKIIVDRLVEQQQRKPIA
ncbi:STM3941 family protein [Bernardetia sp. MNP-M8]|uniref:STM3941 family protein n=1 Tax=Bernardetia sp. MNP-M8 TaxID=3127470 RepID=UPI0030CAED17